MHTIPHSTLIVPSLEIYGVVYLLSVHYLDPRSLWGVGDSTWTFDKNLNQKINSSLPGFQVKVSIRFLRIFF